MKTESGNTTNITKANARVDATMNQGNRLSLSHSAPTRKSAGIAKTARSATMPSNHVPASFSLSDTSHYSVLIAVLPEALRNEMLLVVGPTVARSNKPTGPITADVFCLAHHLAVTLSLFSGWAA
jgi:hypothetical protein